MTLVDELPPFRNGRTGRKGLWFGTDDNHVLSTAVIMAEPPLKKRKCVSAQDRRSVVRFALFSSVSAAVVLICDH